MKKKISGLLLCVFFLSGSAKASEVWVKPCSDHDGDFISAKLVKINNQWNFSDWGYEDEPCNMPYIQLDRLYQLKSVGLKSDSDGPQIDETGKMDLQLIDALYTPLTDEVARALNDSGFCGIENWKMNMAVSILGKPCASVDNYQPGQMTYSIWKKTKIDGDVRLWLGESSIPADGSTAEKRHQVFEVNAYSLSN
jgi:hypothetical protein